MKKLLSLATLTLFFGLQSNALPVVPGATPATPLFVTDNLAIAKLTEQIKTANDTLSKTTAMVRNTDRLMQIAGNPKQMLNSIRDVNDAIRQLDRIGHNGTTRAVRNLSRSFTNLQASRQEFKSTVDNTMIVSGEKKSRDASLYQGFRIMEDALDDYTTLIKDDQAIQKREFDRQIELENELKTASTQAELDKISIALAASKAIQDASSDKVLKAKDLMDTQKLALDTEKEKRKQVVMEKKDAEMQVAVSRSQKKFLEHRKNFNEKIQKTVAVTSYAGLPPELLNNNRKTFTTKY